MPGRCLACRSSSIPAGCASTGTSTADVSKPGNGGESEMAHRRGMDDGFHLRYHADRHLYAAHRVTCVLGRACGLCFTRRDPQPLTAGVWRTLLGPVSRYERGYADVT